MTRQSMIECHFGYRCIGPAASLVVQKEADLGRLFGQPMQDLYEFMFSEHDRLWVNRSFYLSNHEQSLSVV